MANMWLWFETQEQRLEFVKQMLKLKPVAPQGRSRAAREAAAAESQLWEELLLSLNQGKTKGAWYDLEKTFYMAHMRDHTGRPDFERQIWALGFRRIYSVRSYFYRPGFWLVLKFRECKVGRKMREWVAENFPEEHLGTHVPVPPYQEGIFNLREASFILNNLKLAPDKLLARLARAQEFLEQALRLCPQEYRKLEYLTLWEWLAEAWEGQDRAEQACYCYKKQTELKPSRPEAWIKLGIFYQGQGRDKEAYQAYQRGLKIGNYDPDLVHGLTALWGAAGKEQDGLTLLSTAMVERPDITTYNNMKLFGELSLKVGHYHAAHSCCNRALYDAPPGWPLARECRQILAQALAKDGKPRQALAVLEKALSLEEHSETMLQYAETLSSCKEWEPARHWLKKLLSAQPKNFKAWKLLKEIRYR